MFISFHKSKTPRWTLDDLVDELFGVMPASFGFVLDFLTMLVRAGQEHLTS